MIFSGYDSGRRYRRRASERRRKVFAFVVCLLAISVVSYWWGGENVRSSEVAYKEQALRLQDERSGLDQTITGLQAQVQSAQVRYHQLESKYMQDVPQGDFKTLTDIVKKRLDAGVKPQRLAFLIDAARPPRNCTAPIAKRFVVKTPVYNGPHGTVSFGGGAVTVSGEGDSAVSAQGQKEAWYDSGKPVKINFTEIGGKVTVKSGLLPLQESLVVGAKEYRFTIATGARSFITVTEDSCDYP